LETKAKLPIAGRVYAGILALLAVCYLAQIFTPIRINDDAVTLLSEAESVAHNEGFLLAGQKTLYPPGYPALLASLLRMGVAHTWVILSLNAVFLFVGLFALRYVLTLTFFRDQGYVLMVYALSLLSFIFIIFFSLPLTDVPFFCVAMCCLASMEHTVRLTVGGRFWRWLAVDCFLLLGSIAVRRVGLALIPAFLWMIISHPAVKRYLKDWSLRRSISAIGSLVFLVIVVTGWTADNLNVSLRDFRSTVHGQRLPYIASSIIGYRLTELGQIAANIPSHALPKPIQHVLPWVGLLTLTTVMVGLFLKRKSFGPSEVFVVGYLAIMFAWPMSNPRLWLPIIPLLIFYCTLAVAHIAARKYHLLAKLMAVYLTVYAVLGLDWLASSTMITFSRSAFLTMYVPHNEYSATYCAVLGTCKDGFDPAAVDQNVAHILRLYK
jgi:hypothetical protein